MRLFRVMVVLLLPALWLAVAVGSFGGPAGLTGAEAHGQGHAPAGAPPQEFSGQASDAEAVSLPPVRRQRPESALPAPAAHVMFKNAPLACPVEYGTPQTVEVMGLARTWQFRLRAALHPRAPTRLS
jgi:hypothetical protein